MPGMRNVISTLTDNGEEVMGPEILLWHYPENNIMNGSLLTVESNHFCVLKSRGAILQVYETGQYPVQTPDRPLFGSMQQAFYGGQREDDRVLDRKSTRLNSSHTVISYAV